MPKAIKLKFSLIYTMLLLVSYVAALSAIFYCDFSWLAKLIFAVMILLSAYYYWCRYILLRHNKSIVAILNYGNHGWELLQKNGIKLIGKLSGIYYMSQYLILLNFKLSGKKRLLPLIIFSDAVDKELLRQLRLYLYSLK